MLEPAAGLKIRQEYFGGIAFNVETGLSADLDKAAFRMLATVEFRSGVTVDVHE